MADNLAARQDSDFTVVCTSPSVNLTPRGNSVVPVPYQVKEDLSSAAEVSQDVRFNGNWAYIFTSNSSKVTGDGQGSAGGVASGTVEAKSEPLESSTTVYINKQMLVRCGDMQKMQGGNTLGKITCSGGAAAAATITDEGKIEKSDDEEEKPGLVDGLKDGTELDELAEKVQNGEALEEAEAYVDEMGGKVEAMGDEYGKRYDALTQAYEEGGVEGLVDRAVQTAQEEADELSQAGSALWERISQIPDEIGVWADKVGDKYATAMEYLESGNLKYGAGMMAATTGQALLDVVNPGKKAKLAGEAVDSALDAKHKAMFRGKDKDKPKSESSGDGNDGRDGGNITGDGDCKKMVLKMDCSGYPTDKAPLFSLKKSPQTLDISPKKRCDRNAAGKKLVRNFNKKYKDGVTGNTRKFLQERFGLDDAALSKGKTALNALKAAGEEINMHHILPGWAGGSDDGSNLIPVSSSGKPSDHTQVHNWWKSKTEAGRDELIKKAKACDEKNNKSEEKNKKPGRKNKTHGHNNGDNNEEDTGIMECLTKKNDDYLAFCESQMTDISKCLDDKGAKLQLEITCPDAVNK